MSNLTINNIDLQLKEFLVDNKPFSLRKNGMWHGSKNPKARIRLVREQQNNKDGCSFTGWGDHGTRTGTGWGN